MTIGEGQELFNHYSFLEVIIATKNVKAKKLMKYGFFKVSRIINEKHNKFKLQDDFVLHYTFYPPDCIQARG